MAYKKVEASFYSVELGMHTLYLGRETGSPKGIAGFVHKYGFPLLIIPPSNIGQVTDNSLEAVKQ